MSASINAKSAQLASFVPVEASRAHFQLPKQPNHTFDTVQKVCTTARSRTMASFVPEGQKPQNSSKTAQRCTIAGVSFQGRTELSAQYKKPAQLHNPAQRQTPSENDTRRNPANTSPCVTLRGDIRRV
jgi:hypothetical protein